MPGVAEDYLGLQGVAEGCSGSPGFLVGGPVRDLPNNSRSHFILCTLNGNNDATSGYALHLSINATLINVCTNCCSNVVTKSKQRNSKGVYKVQMTCSNVFGNYNKFTTFIDTLKLGNKGSNQHHLDCSNDLCSSNKMPLGLQRFYNESLL